MQSVNLVSVTMSLDVETSRFEERERQIAPVILDVDEQFTKLVLFMITL